MDLEKIRKQLKPDTSVLKNVASKVAKINELIRLKNIDAQCIVAGSIAKMTFIANDYDVDLFVRFNIKYENISDILEDILKNNFQYDRVHGSRDYFQVHEDITYEIVPVYNISDYRQAKNVTDMSPLHVHYVQKKIGRLADDIRLGKQFCKAAKVYGAESYIQGFSGHIIDLLIINFGSFENLMKSASTWNIKGGNKIVIDIEKHLKNPLKELDNAKTHSPLVIVDPVQPDRNAAAALSKEKCDIFIQQCKKFLNKPSENFFKVNALKNKKKNNSVFLEIESLKGKKDVVGAKLMKAFEYLVRSVKRVGFTIVDKEWEFNKKGLFYIEVKEKILPKELILTGPPLDKKEGVKAFKKKHAIVFEKDNRLYAKEELKTRTLKSLVKETVKQDYFQERVASVKITFN